MLRVLICDRSLVVRNGLRALLATETDIEVVETTGSGAEALDLARVRCPEVVVTGLELNGMTGIDLVRQLTGSGFDPAPRVIVFAMSGGDEPVAAALHAGATGLLVRDVGRDELVSAVHAVANGQAMLAPRVAQQLVDWFRRRGTGAETTLREVVRKLTPREREVLLLTAQGMQPEEIAGRLCIGVATVRTHIYRLRGKLELKDRAQLVSFAYQAGLMQPV